MAKKVEKRFEYREVIYDEKRWRILGEKRRKAVRIMSVLERRGFRVAVHGSIARGDVHESSDVDVVILYPVPSYLVELALEEGGYRPYERIIIQATPSSTPKAYYVLDEVEELVVSHPLANLKTREYEFYRFGGMVYLEDLQNGKRVPGVDKRLVLIEPTPKGHRESPVIGREGEVARILGISPETIIERVRVLSRRDEIGRTGVFVKYVLHDDESIEEAAKKLSRENPYFRRMLRRGGLL